MLRERICAGGAGSTGVPTATRALGFSNLPVRAKSRHVMRSSEINKAVAKGAFVFFNTLLVSCHKEALIISRMDFIGAVCKAAMLARMSSADLRQMKGLGCSL